MSDSVEAPLWIKLNVSQAGSRGDEREIPHLHSSGRVWETQAQSCRDLGSRETGGEIEMVWGEKGRDGWWGRHPCPVKEGQLAAESIQVEGLVIPSR